MGGTRRGGEALAQCLEQSREQDILLLVTRKENRKRKMLPAFSIIWLQALGRKEVKMPLQRCVDGWGLCWAGREALSRTEPREGPGHPQPWDNPRRGSHTAFIKDLGASLGWMFTFKFQYERAEGKRKCASSRHDLL